MKKKNIKQCLIAATATLSLSACDVKAPIYETEHPEHGKITLTTDWTNIGTGITIPTDYTVRVGEYSATLTGTTNKIGHLFMPGSYAAYVYNPADNIAVNGTTATANYSAGTLGCFFTCAMTVAIEKDKHHEFTAVMRQQVRQLTLVIEPTGDAIDQIATITATLSGVASTLAIDNDTHGTATTVPLTFAKITSGTDAGKWTATIRLLGITGSQQKLTGQISFTGDKPEVVNLKSDLSMSLATFNDNKKEPLSLETSTGTGFTATITGWNPVTGESVIAN